MTEEEILGFVRSTIATSWELELLLLLHRTCERSWTVGELIRELRASHQTIDDAIRRLRAFGALAEGEKGNVRYSTSEKLTDVAAKELASLFQTKPFAVMNAIRDAQSRQLKNFSDAFRFKE